MSWSPRCGSDTESRRGKPPKPCGPKLPQHQLGPDDFIAERGQEAEWSTFPGPDVALQNAPNPLVIPDDK